MITDYIPFSGFTQAGVQAEILKEDTPLIYN